MSFVKAKELTLEDVAENYSSSFKEFYYQLYGFEDFDFYFSKETLKVSYDESNLQIIRFDSAGNKYSYNFTYDKTANSIIYVNSMYNDVEDENAVIINSGVITPLIYDIIKLQGFTFEDKKSLFAQK